ncbi:putative membrane protein [Phyllobacterium myrsinacearum]|uniref:DUF1036 domain-containing protein n=1 Tax=Phyllobacterium myrsinacearum TaxID=28101 RepID=UPI0010EC7B76|nr:DUF1036 domain-containing protein [Phyllobacterium myrsinacearum]RZS76763.1 putative membrane protein [Phyllobacterium myrsinacearum]
MMDQIRHSCCGTGRKTQIFNAKETFWFAAVLAAPLVCAAPDAAHAAFTVCNQTADVANVAIGEQVGGEMRTEGWWAVAANRCADVIKSKLSNRYIYVHAIDVRGRPILDGAVTLCVDTKKFQITGKDACWQRNHLRGVFKEVDTQSSDNWTLFLTDRH